MAVNAVDGSTFSNVTYTSKSTKKGNDNSTYFQTIVDNATSTDSTKSTSSTTSTSKTSSTDTISVSGSSNPTTDEIESYFEEAANTYGVDVDLLKALGYEESRWQADAVSSSGAIGIMQLMPSTASSLGVEDPYDARQNIMGGAKLLASHLKKYNGNVTLALAAYGAGSGAVDKYNGVPPYASLKTAINRVLNYYHNGLDTDQDAVNYLDSDSDDSSTSAVAGSSTTSTSATSDSDTSSKDALTSMSALDLRLASIPSRDIYLTSNVETDMISDTTSSTSSTTSTATVSSSDSSLSYEDYLDYLDDYVDILGGLSGTSSSSSSSDDLSSTISSTLLNTVSDSSSTTNYSDTILSVLQSVLASQ